MIEQDYRKRARPMWLPEESLQSKRAAWNDNCFVRECCRLVCCGPDPHWREEQYQRRDSQRSSAIGPQVTLAIGSEISHYTGANLRRLRL